jgi:phenylacetate-CoA ligase
MTDTKVITEMAYGSAFQQQVFEASPAPVKNLVASIYGLREIRRRHGEYYRYHLERLRKSQWLAVDDLTEMQLTATREYLSYAAEHSNHFKKLFTELDFNPHDFTSLEQLTKLPLLEKQLLRTDINPFISDEISKLGVRWSQTSGTTGMPLSFPLSRECFQREHAFRYLHYEWGGVFRGQKMAFCAGHPVTYHDRTRPPFWVYDAANRWLLLSSYHLTRNNLSAYIKKLNAFKPALLAGYPSSLYLLARANRAAGSPVQPTAVFASSETIFDYQRLEIEASFGCKLYGWYGTGEMCVNIVQCDHGNYHLKQEHSLIEVINNDRPALPGESGRLLCTGFGNRALMLIRYDIGDEVELSAQQNCNCGRSGTIIKQVFGRAEQYIVTPDGRLVGRLDHLFKGDLNVIQAQLVQEVPMALVIRVVRDRDYQPADEHAILAAARERLGKSIRIDFEYVESIPRTANGKYRFIVSSLKEEMIHNMLTESD